MIDYEKLKEAHELAAKYSKQTDSNCEIAFCCQQSNRKPYLRFRYGAPGLKLDIPYELDDLIIKLKELTQPEPGQIEKILTHIPRQRDGSINMEKGKYCLIDGEWYRETDMTLHNPKDASTLYAEGVKHIYENVEKECEHEQDYGHQLLNPLQIKCKKCGEFYKGIIDDYAHSMFSNRS